jgi:archaellum component FlaC
METYVQNTYDAVRKMQREIEELKKDIKIIKRMVESLTSTR